MDDGMVLLSEAAALRVDRVWRPRDGKMGEQPRIPGREAIPIEP
jgi:hypothetical protein